MMKNYIFVIIAVFMFSFSYGQIHSGTIIYKIRATRSIKKTTEKIKNSNVKEAVVKKLTKLKKAAPFLSCRLDFNGEKSFFEWQDIMANDNGMDLNKTYYSASGHGGSFYTNLNENINVNQLKSFGKKFLVQMSLNSLNWKITKETKKIKGYLCQKAEVVTQINVIHKGTVTAWFTREIPFQFGPLQFAGLPGMILGLERNHFYFYADKITFSQKDKTINRPTRGELITEKGFYEDIRKVSKQGGYR